MSKRGAAPRHALPKRRRSVRALRRVLVGVVALALVLGGAGFLYYRHLEGNIEVIAPNLGKNRPDPGPRGPLNILLIGSDERTAGGGVLGEGGDLADTLILLHLSADRSRAYGVSITRDLLVDRPSCPGKDEGGPEIPAEAGAQINEAYLVGGPNCTWKTVEALTGILIDDIVVVKFDGFQRMVGALGGVPVCVPEEVDRPDLQIYIKAGSYDIKGDMALDYVRARKGIGDGTDIGRMKRQQAFLASMANKAISAGTLLNPLKLVPFLEAVTDSIQASPGLAKLSRLRQLAGQLKNIGPSSVKFLSMPVAIPPEDVNRRVPAPEAGALWRRIKADQELTPAQLQGAIDAGQDPQGTPTGTPPAQPQTPPASPADAPTDDAAAAREAVGLCA